MRRLIIFVTLLPMLSCHKKDDSNPVISDYEVINSWVEKNLKYYYLWNDRINTDGINKNENPEQYFKRFIVPEDHYSYIKNDFKSLLLKWSENKKTGYAYFLYSTKNDDVIGKITYIVEKSPADKAGLKRGMVFTKINGISLSKNNYQDLILQIADKHTLSIRNNNDLETDYSVSIAEFVENPIFLDTVYDFNNRKVGYLVYNSFISDNGDFSQEYDIQLNNVFEKFRNENINELILDLRYNCKGDILNSMIMASLIVKNPDIKEIYAKYQYNKSLQQIICNEFGNDYLNLHYTDAINNKALNNIGDKLNRVFILTSPKTGVMGEILINGLKLSMNVIIVGNTTTGRNIFSLFLYENDPVKQKINTWAIVPAVIQISNSVGNTDISSNPDIEITEPLYDNTPLGDVNEHVLSATLNTILEFSSLSTFSEHKNAKHNIIPQQMPVDHLQSLSIKSIPRK
jgi:hypothetical protein